MVNRVIIGHVLDALKMLDDDSVHLVCSSPPYWGLRDNKGAEVVWGDNNCDHEWGAAPPRRRRSVDDVKNLDSKQATNLGANIDLTPTAFCARCGAWRGQLGLEPTPELYVEHLVEIFREVKRVLRPDGSCWINLGDSYMSHPARSKNVGGFQGEQMRRNPDYCDAEVIGRKTRPAEIGLKDKDLVGIPWRVAFALQADGWYLRRDIIWFKRNPMPESCRDRPTTAHEYIFLFTKSGRYFYDCDAVREPHKSESLERDELGYQAAFKGRHTSPGENRPHSDDHEGFCNPAGRNLRSVWDITTRGCPEAHFATFPPELPAKCIKTSPTKICLECGAGWERVVERKGGTPTTYETRGKTRPEGYGGTDSNKWEYNAGTTVGGAEVKTLGFRPTCSCEGETGRAVILDPFGGRGTTAQVALDLGRDFIHIDIGYPELAEKTLGLYCPEVEYVQAHQRVNAR